MVFNILKLLAFVVLFVDGLRADTNFLTGANDIIVVRDQVKLTILELLFKLIKI